MKLRKIDSWQSQWFLQILFSVCLSFQALSAFSQEAGELKIAPIWGLKNYSLFTESINEVGISYELLAFQRLGIEVGALTRKNHSVVDLCPFCPDESYDWRSLGVTLNVKYYVDGPGQYSGLYIAVAGANFTHLNSAAFKQMLEESKMGLAKEYQDIFPANPLEIGGMLGYKVLLWKHLVLEPVAFYGHDFKYNSEASSRAAITFKLGYRF